MIHTVDNFFNKAADDIRAKYFPELKYYRDDKNCASAHYAIELFNNGCLTYRQFIGRLAKCCNDTNGKIHSIIEKHIVSFGSYEYKPKN